jgi:hypothetical protein
MRRGHRGSPSMLRVRQRARLDLASGDRTLLPPPLDPVFCSCGSQRSRVKDQPTCARRSVLSSIMCAEKRRWYVRPTGHQRRSLHVGIERRSPRLASRDAMRLIVSRTKGSPDDFPSDSNRQVMPREVSWFLPPCSHRRRMNELRRDRSCQVTALVPVGGAPRAAVVVTRTVSSPMVDDRWLTTSPAFR